MVWAQLGITNPHLVYIILGGFTSLFMLCSSFIKERMYIGEATVATLTGVIFGPHAANLINPNSWGSTDIITIEFSRIVLVVQCFAVGVELPKFYMERHWRSVVYLLVPVMTFGWFVTSLVVWWMIPAFDWLDSLVVAACVTATDPVLASSVVGKGKFAKRVPKHLRDLLSAESGCNDGMAFPFIYLSLYLIKYKRDAADVSLHFVCYTILYECIFGAVYGFIVGYIARHGIKYAEKHDMIDRESFLVFYFVLSLFCAGSGSLLGLDDLLVGFAAGVGFSNDGWFSERTEESHVSNVIDLLLNLAYFVYLGTIIPWETYNAGGDIPGTGVLGIPGVPGLKVWRLVVIALFVLFFRRIPIMLALKPLIPDIRTWREGLFAGHFGPIGVGAVFIAMLARGELQTGASIPSPDMKLDLTNSHYNLIYLVWPVVSFLVVTSIIVHGSSIAVFTLGKRINTLTLTMSYTAAIEDGPSWMNRLPRISSTSRSQAKMSEASFDEKDPQFPENSLAPGGFLSRRKEGGHSRQGSRTSSLVSRKRKPKKDDGAGGPISQSAIFPTRDTAPISPQLDSSELSGTQHATDSSPSSDSGKEKAMDTSENQDNRRESPSREPVEPVAVYEEGDDLIFENQDGDVLDIQKSPRASRDKEELPPPNTSGIRPAANPWSLEGMRQKVSNVYTTEMEKRKGKEKSSRKAEPARAYQFGNTIIVEDEDGEVVKTYHLPSQKPEGADRFHSSLKYMGLGGLAKAEGPASHDIPTDQDETSTSGVPASKMPSVGWASHLARRKINPAPKDVQDDDEDDDRKIRFTIGGVGKRMTKEDFIREVQKLTPDRRREVVASSSASEQVKSIATQERPPNTQHPAIPHKIIQKPSTETEKSSSARPSSSDRPKTARSHEVQPSELQGETAAERKRRLAVLSAQNEDDEIETPAERRRREAALGLGLDGEGGDKGGRIRFAEPERGRK